MWAMKRSLILICAVTAALSAGSAFAQTVLPRGSLYNPPPLAPLPPPRIEVPAIPKLDAVPAQSSVRSPGRTSFGDRASRCLDEGAAAGLNQADRSTYSRSCANLRD